MTESIQQTRITLSNLKVAEFASEETLCFRAVVVFDGIAIADAENDGRGGCTFLRARKGSHEKLAEAEAFAKALPPLLMNHEEPGGTSRNVPIDITLHLLVDELAEDMQNERKIRARFRRDITQKVLYIKDERLLFLRGTNLRSVQDPDAFFALLRGKHGADTVILNTLPSEEAFALWKKHVVR